MEWRRMKKQDLAVWHQWYAWRPASLSTNDPGYTEIMVWLQIIERRSVHSGIWEYRELEG